LARLPVVSAKEAIKDLERLGFKVYRQTGSHIHLWNEERRLVVIVPNHRSWQRALDLYYEAGRD
jgi:predicted RNA binding protein YcfA (HicA-like mRNA interferase family)